jgi:hypothetical protein
MVETPRLQAKKRLAMSTNVDEPSRDAISGMQLRRGCQLPGSPFRDRDCCGAKMRIVSAIHALEVIRKILECLGLPLRQPPIVGAIPEGLSWQAGVYLA